LEKLTAGEHLFIRETSEGIRMLGAVRAVEQCIQCHGGERGDLLGAFSYSLTRTSNP
jgi:mono/diheme cytochrome c family protein